MKLLKAPIALAPLFILLFLTACSFSLAEDITPPPRSEQLSAPQTQPAPISGPLYPLVAPNPSNGEPIYTEKCAPCHGVSGLGDGPRAAQLPNPVTPLGSQEIARQSTPARWYTQVTQGNLERFMPPFNSLSDRERWDVVAYAFSLSLHPQASERGAELFQANCAGCHGENGQGDGPDASGLALDFTDQSVMAEKTTNDFYQAITAGVPPGMPGFDDTLNEEERWILADYLRMLPFSTVQEPVAEAAATQEPASAAIETETVSAAETEAAADTKAVGTEIASAASGKGIVMGEVTNASSGELSEDVVVTLHGFDDMQAVLTDTVKLQADGSYLFEDVEMPEGRAFLVAVEYGDATYGSDIAVVEPEMSIINLPVTVYETTTDTSVLKGDRLHLFFEFLDAETVRVIQLYILSNTSQQTLVPAAAGQPTITYQLPEGAKNLEFQDGVLGERFVETPGGFGDTAAVRPGTGAYQVLFAFEMPYDRRLELVQPIPTSMDAVVALVPEGGIKIKSEMLQDAGPLDVEGTQYHTYNGSSFEAGEELRLTISGRPGSGSAALSAGSTTNLVVGLGAFGVALVLSGVWIYRRTRARAVDEQEDTGEAVEEGESFENAETVMDAILALDDLYQAGQLPEEAYLQRRAELKAKLKALLE